MSAFDLYPQEVAGKSERGKPIDLSAGAGFFEGALTAPFTGAAKGLVVEPARVLNLGMSFAPDMVDRALGTNTRDWWFENMMLTRAAHKVTPNSRETGLAGQMLHGLFDVGGQAVAGGPLNVLVNKTVGGAIEGVEAGLDTATAMKKGGIEGGAAALGVALPIAIPPVGSKIPALVQQLAYGVASNVPLGIAQRGLTHQVLADAGYAAMAEQYKALDEAGLMTDMVLGLAFGGLGHAIQSKGAKLPFVRPSDVDAALAKRNAYHLEIDTAPGLARDAQTRDAHVDSVLKATEDLIAGRPVDVSQELHATNFEPNPALDRARGELLEVQREIAKAYDTVLERPIGPADDPLVRMTSADIGQVLLERGAAVLKESGEVRIPGRGYGLVKVIWKHGEQSKKAPELQVTKEDVLGLPHVLHEYSPADVSASGDRVAYRIDDGAGRIVVYGVSKFRGADDANHVVTIHVEPKAAGPLSKPKGPASESPAGIVTPDRDTAGGLPDQRTRSQNAGANVAQIGDALKAEGLPHTDENVAKVQLIARARAIDAAAVDALPDRMPDGEYLAKIKEIVDAHESTQAADQGGQGAAGARPAAEGGGARPGEEGGQAARGPGGEAQPGGESARAVEQAEIRAAEGIAAEHPEMFVTMEDGTVVSAHEALARADEVIALAEHEAKAFEAAVMCATRRGG